MEVLLPKLGLAVSQKRITPRSGSTSDTPAKCHSLVSPSSRAAWICSLMGASCSSISSWAKYRPCFCSVMRLLLPTFPIPLLLVIRRGYPEHEHYPPPQRHFCKELLIQRHLLGIRG